MKKKLKKKNETKTNNKYIYLLLLILILIVLILIYEYFVGFYGAPSRCFDTDGSRISDYNDTCSKDVVIPERVWFKKVDTIGAGAFTNKGLTSVKLNNNIKHIEDYAFSNNNLKDLKLNRDLLDYGQGIVRNNDNFKTKFWYKLEDGKYDYSVIIDYTGDKGNELDIPSNYMGVNLKTIGDDAFNGFGFTDVNIPLSVEVIGKGAFGYNKFTSVNLPKNLKILDDGSFSGNYLKNINLPVGIKVIGNNVFSNSDIEVLNIPGSIENIGLTAFTNMDKLKVINIAREKNNLGDFYHNNGGAEKAIVNWLK